MSDLKIKPTTITLNEKEYELWFTINVIEDIQEHFDIPIANIGDLMSDSKNAIKNLRFLITCLVNEGIDIKNDNGANLEKVTERYVGRYINVGNMKELTNAIYKSIQTSTPESEDNPNAQSE